jgi:hypothetical protein
MAGCLWTVTTASPSTATAASPPTVTAASRPPTRTRRSRTDSASRRTRTPRAHASPVPLALPSRASLFLPEGTSRIPPGDVSLGLLRHSRLGSPRYSASRKQARRPGRVPQPNRVHQGLGHWRPRKTSSRELRSYNHCQSLRRRPRSRIRTQLLRAPHLRSLAVRLPLSGPCPVSPPGQQRIGWGFRYDRQRCHCWLFSPYRLFSSCSL